MLENEYLSSRLCVLGRIHRMPSSENSSPTIDVLKRLVAQHKSARHQHHEPMADELTSCPMTPIYNKVAHEPAADRHLYINKVSSSSDQPSPIKAATAPSQSKVAVTTDQPASRKKVSSTPQVANSQRPTANSQQPTTKQPTANSQRQIANSQQPTTKQPTANSQRPTANSQQPTANSQQPTANS